MSDSDTDSSPSPFLSAVWTWQAIPSTIAYTVFIQGTEAHLRKRPLVRYGLAGLIGGLLLMLVLIIFPVPGSTGALFIIETTMCFLGVTLCVDMMVMGLQTKAFGKLLQLL